MISNKAKLGFAIILLFAFYMTMVAVVGTPPVLTMQAMTFCLVAALSLSAGGYVFRYIVRERQGLARVQRNKSKSAHSVRSMPTYKGDKLDISSDDLMWFYLTPQSFDSDSAKVSMEALTAAVKQLDTNPGTTIAEISSRATHAFVLRRTEEGVVSLYLGTSRLDAESSVQNFGASAGYAVEVMDRPPQVGTGGGFTMASRPKRIDHMSIEAVAQDAEGLIRALAGSRESSFVGNVVVTFEGARPFEVKRFIGNSNEQSIEYGGEMNKTAGGNGGGGSVGSKSSTMANSLLRSTIFVSADSASKESSESALNTVLGAFTTLPFVLNARKPAPWHRKKSLWVLLAYWSFAVVVGLIGLLPLPVMVIASIPAIAGTVATAINPEWLVDSVIDRELKRGYVPVPVSSYLSQRWFFASIFRSFQRNAGSQERVENEIAYPSPPEVVPMYAAPMTELVKPYQSALNNNQAREKFPLVELEREFETYSPMDILLGLSSKGQLVTLSVFEMNFGWAGFGKPNGGKTNEMHIAYARCAQLSVARGMDFTLTPVLYENKGPGAYKMWKWVKHLPGARLYEVNRPSSPNRIALEGPRLGDTTANGSTVGVRDIMGAVSNLIGQLQTAFGTQGQVRTNRIMDNVLHIASLLDKDDLEDLELDRFVNPTRPNLMKLSLLLLGNDDRVDVSEGLKDMMDADYDESLPESELQRRATLADYISRFVSVLDSRNSQELVDSVVNRFQPLADCPMFEPLDGQYEVSVGELVNANAPVIINFGQYPVKLDTGRTSMENSVRADVIGTTMRMLQNAMWTYAQTHNGNWQEEHRFIQNWSDEASLFGVPSTDAVSGKEESTISHINDQGRAFGYGQILFSQRTSKDHMADSVKSVMTGSANLTQFTMRPGDDLDVVVNALGDPDVVPFSKNNLIKMPMGLAAARLEKNFQATNVFTLRVPKFEDIAHAIIDVDDPTRPIDVKEIGTAMKRYYAERAARKKRHSRDVADRKIDNAGRRGLPASRS